MRLLLSILLLVAAAALLIFGFQGADSLASSFKEAFTGTPTDNSVFLIVAGAVCAVFGLLFLPRRPRLAD